MTTLRCAAAAFLMGVALPVSASAASIQIYEESVEFILQYFSPVGGGWASIYEDNPDCCHWTPGESTAYVSPGSGDVTFGDVPLISIYFQFLHAGISGFGDPQNLLLGKTVNFDAMIAGDTSADFPQPVYHIEWQVASWRLGFWSYDFGWWEPDYPFMATFGGSITFDETGVSTRHAMNFFNMWYERDWEMRVLKSDPFILSGSGHSYLNNPSDIDGRPAYDSVSRLDYYGGFSSFYSFAPGQWRIAHAAKECWMDGPTECLAAPAPIPLPASAWLLLSGLGALGARGVWNRRRILT